MPFRLPLGKPLQEPVALMTDRYVGTGARVRLVDDHEFRTGAQEIVAPPVGLDVVERDDGVRVDLEDGFPGPQSPFETSRRPGGHDFGVDVEFRGQFVPPLVAQMRRADDDGPFDFAPVDHLPRDQPRFDGFSDADVVRDEKADHVGLQGHEQRHELVGARFERKIAETAERPRSGSELEAQRIPQKERRLPRPGPVGVGRRKGRRRGRLRFERQIDERCVLFASAERTKPEDVRVRAGKDDPLPPPRLYEIAGLESDRGRHDVSPSASPSPKTHA